MGTCTFIIDWQSQSIKGLKLIGGTLEMGSTYATSGDSLNLANYFKSTSKPTLLISSDAGYLLVPTPGRNADSMLIEAYDVGWYAINANSGSANQAATQIGNGSAVLASTNAMFLAFGQPY